IGRKDLPWALTEEGRDSIVEEVQQQLEQYTSQKLVLTGSVGVRAYSQGTIIAPHVDELPFVLTAVLHIAQDRIEGEWPLQLVAREVDGSDSLQNIQTSPGEMVIYEGTSVIHGRPSRLQGMTGDGGDASSPQNPLCSNTIGEIPAGATSSSSSSPTGSAANASTDPAYVALLYLHFEPVGYTAQHTLHQMQQEEDQEYSPYMPTTTEALDKASKAAFEKAFQAQQQPTEDDPSIQEQQYKPRDAVPRYVWKEYQDLYLQKFVFQHDPQIYPKSTKVVLGTITPHQAAALGDVDALKSLAKNDRSQLFKADLNGWRPLHEAARSGHADVLEYLLDEGAQVNARTNNNKGGTALYWAEKKPVENTKAIAVLKKYGAVNIPPGDGKEKKKN
ncbi:MAG: hypothetical protein SGILL_010216, partial [Bacillariaceae sp.]